MQRAARLWTVDWRLPRLRLRVHGNELGYAGGALVLLLVAVAALAPLLTAYDPEKLSLTQRLRPPGPDHLFGTDEYGRDLFSRVLFGARISLQVAATVIVIATTIGVSLGATGAYRGGRWDEVVMRVSDVFMAFPDLVLAMALSAALGASLTSAIVAVSIVWWPTYARLIRGQVLSLKQQPFIEAARAIGASERHILARHVVPNTLSPLVVRITTDVGYAILYTASLGFIGLGAQEPTPEWGRMVATGRFYLLEQWWYPTLPGLAIFLAVLGFTWLGDAVRDALDPRLRRGRR
ncbi:MAG: ABC transporter permease [Chloroflexota bacterium]|nr:ABC transporter permease [Chloroflexota bacterium]